MPGIWRKALHDCLEIRSLGFHFERIQTAGDVAHLLAHDIVVEVDSLRPWNAPPIGVDDRHVREISRPAEPCTKTI